MDAPVDENAAAGNGLGGKRTAEAGDIAVATERNVGLEDVAQLAALDVFTDAVDSTVKAVDDTNVENLAGLVLSSLHFQRFLINTGSGFFTQHVLAGTQAGNRDLLVNIIGGADGHRLHLGIVQNDVVVGDSGAAAVVGNSFFRTLGNDVAKVLNDSVFVFDIRGDVRHVGDRTATNDSNNDRFHKTILPFYYVTFIIKQFYQKEHLFFYNNDCLFLTLFLGKN